MNTNVRLALKDGVLRPNDKGTTIPGCKTPNIMNSVQSIEIKWKGLDDRFSVQLSVFLRGCKYLTSIDLSDNYIGDSGCKELAESLATLTTLKTLVLAGNKIADLGVAIISSMLTANRCIAELDLSGNSVQKVGMQALGSCLRDNYSLITLKLEELYFGDDGAVELGWAIMYNTSLTNLVLRANNIRNAGITTLATGLKKNIGLIKLDLSDNDIGDRGIIKLSEAMFRNTTLQSVNLALNNFGPEGKDALLDVMDFSFRWEPAPDDFVLAIAMSLHTRLGAACKFHNIAVIPLTDFRKVVISGKWRSVSPGERAAILTTIRAKEKEADSVAVTTPPPSSFYQQNPVPANSPLRTIISYVILPKQRDIIFDGRQPKPAEGSRGAP